MNALSKTKQEAVSLRKRGLSYGKIQKRLNVPPSTLQYWVKDVRLASAQQEKLKADWRRGLIKARAKASAWHKEQKIQRLESIQKEARLALENIDIKSVESRELALALLYLGEGNKNTSTCMGNSDPLILKFFIACLRDIYNVPLEAIKCELHIRADQNPKTLRAYWSRILELPLENFGATSVDKRTAGSPSYTHYKGVCLVRCGRVAIQRRLVYIARGFCERVCATPVSNMRG